MSSTRTAGVSTASTMPPPTIESSTCVENSTSDQTEATASPPPNVVQEEEHRCPGVPSKANIRQERTTGCAKTLFPTSESTQIPSTTSDPAQSDRSNRTAAPSPMQRESCLQAEKTENDTVTESLSPRTSAGSPKSGSKCGEDDSMESDSDDESSHGQDGNVPSEPQSRQEVTDLLDASHDAPDESDEIQQVPEIVAEQAKKSADLEESENNVHHEQNADVDFEQEGSESEKSPSDGSEEQRSSDNNDIHLGGAQAAFLSGQDPGEEEEIASFNQQSSEDYPEDNTLQSAILPAFSTSLITRDSFNFPTGAELLGGPTHRQTTEFPPRATTLPNDTGIHEDEGLLDNTRAIVRHSHQNIVRRLGYDDPSSNEIWTNMAAQCVGSSALDSSGNSGNPDVMSALADSQGPISSLLSESIQESSYIQGEPLYRGSRGQSPFSPEAPQMQTEALHLCLNPTFGAPGADSDFSALGMNLMALPNTGLDQLARNSHSPRAQSSNQQQFLNMPMPSPLATMVQTALAQRSHMHLPGSHDLGLAHAAPATHFFGSPEATDWQNEGNELTFLPGSDSTMHTHDQPFPVQLNAQAHQPAPELATYASNGRDSMPPPLSAINPIFEQSFFQNADGHDQLQSPAALANSQLQGLSLSLSPHQPPSLLQMHPSNHEPSEAAAPGIDQLQDEGAFSARSQARASADAKGKRVVTDEDDADDNGEHCEAGPSSSPFQRLLPIPDPGVAFAVATIGRAFGLKNYGLYPEGEHYPEALANPGNGPFPASSSSRPRLLYGSGGTFPKLFQTLLNELCSVTIGSGATASHDRVGNSNSNPQATSRTPLPFSTPPDEPNVPLTFAHLQRNARVAIAILEENCKGRGQAPNGRRETRESLEKKKVTLTGCIQEIDGRRKAYYARMMDIINRFNSVAGPSSAAPYTALTLQGVLKKFRDLRAFVIVHLKEVKRQLGEQAARHPQHGQTHGHCLAIQQISIPQQVAWRPQRGLPERAVMYLRAWLFEHFLHPYPKDDDKVYLARQTGLTRNQVSNWFINARVRLWKPMVEELYIDEFGPVGPNGLGVRDIRGGYQPPLIENVNVDHEDVDANVDSEAIYGNTGSEHQYQMIQVTAGGGHVLHLQANIGSTSASVPQQNNSTDHEKYVVFDAEQSEASTLKRARSENGMHFVVNNYPAADHSRSPTANMDPTGPFPDPVDPSGGSFYGGAEDQDYSQHHGMLTPSNAERFGIYLPMGENFPTYPAPGTGFLQTRHPRFTNGGVSLTLGLQNVPAPHQSYHGHGSQLDHLAQVHNEAAHHQFNVGIPSDALRIGGMNIVQDNGTGAQFLPLAHQILNPGHGELDRDHDIGPVHLPRQTNRIPNHMLQQLAAQEQLLLRSTRRPEAEQGSLGSMIQNRDEYPGEGSLASVVQDHEQVPVERSNNQSSSNHASTSGSPGMQM